MARDGDRRGVTGRVRDQVAEAALEGSGAYPDDRRAVEDDAGAVAVALDVALELLQEGRHVGGGRLLAGVAAREGEVGLEHTGHLIDVLLHRLDLWALADQRELELKAGQNGAQVVADAGQHGGALLHGALDAALHLDEGGRRAADLARPARPEVRHLAALAEALGGVGKA